MIFPLKNIYSNLLWQNNWLNGSHGPIYLHIWILYRNEIGINKAYLGKYDMLYGVVPTESFNILSMNQVKYGMSAERRNRLLRTYVSNTFDHQVGPPQRPRMGFFQIEILLVNVFENNCRGPSRLEPMIFVSLYSKFHRSFQTKDKN